MINILVTLNRGYLEPLRVLLCSLCESNPDSFFRVFAAHSSLTPEDFKRLEAAVPPDRCRIEDVYVPPDRFPGLPYSKRWPKEACYRIFAAHILPKDLDRILYLDPDIAVINRLDSLYHMDLQGKTLAACTHHFGVLQPFSRARLKMTPGSVYINSGVLVMDLARLRREQKVEQVLAYYKKNKHRIYLFDQDIINGYYSADTLAADPLLYNLDERYYKLYNMNPKNKNKRIDHHWIQKNTAVIHFCSKIKPWDPRYKDEFGKLYYQPYADKIK